MLISRLALLLVVLLPFQGARAANLSEVETDIIHAVDTRASSALELLEQVVNVNSGSMNFAGVRAVADVFATQFDSLGFTTSWVDGEAFNRAGHLIARHEGAGTHFLMIGHLDTVFESDSPFQHYTPISPTKARGPGVIDMKGGNVIILEALRALAAAGVLNDRSVTVVLIGDEESSGRPLSLARAALIQAARAADVALAFEDGDGNPATAVIARRGYTGWRLNVTAKPAHSSLVFADDIGFGAIFETARILDGFRSQLAGERYLTFNPGVILGGTNVNYDDGFTRGDSFGKPNVIAESAVVTGDLRTLSLTQLESAKQRMRAIVGNSLAGTSAEIEFTDGYPPLAPTDGNRRLLEVYARASMDIGEGDVSAVDPGEAGAADVSFTAGLVDMALDGLGLMGKGSHTVDEFADLTTLSSQSKRAALVMYRLRKTQSLR
jgi:glutamate carboxypeptidase